MKGKEKGKCEGVGKKREVLGGKSRRVGGIRKGQREKRVKVGVDKCGEEKEEKEEEGSNWKWHRVLPESVIKP